MRFKNLFIFLLLLSVNILFSQAVIKHTVVEGESIYSIAKKYKVKESDIYELNPNSKGTILQLKTILSIPNKASKRKKTNDIVLSENSEKAFHIVEAGESLYKIAKKYNLSLELLKERNPSVKPESLRIGDKIIINVNQEVPESNRNETVTVASISDPTNKDANLCLDELGNQVHTVVKGETLFKLSKKYKVSIQDLKEMNPEIVTSLPIGYEVIIKRGDVELVSHQNETQSVAKETDEVALANMTKVDFLIHKASQNIGTRYRGGGTTSAGFDCSGLIFTTFKNIDVVLPRTSASMAGVGVKIDRSQAQKGDLIFFTTNGRGYINHVGMVTDVLEDEIKFIHSSVQAGVIISSTKEPYYSRRFVQINRVPID